ncbi:polyprenyl synthetase family protein [SAR202 cluster bacterium AC-409-J13_OGT_754m]|nr:polyprenyl synthetase family protein [SAR202 cluster bacterium AC-409-J13_OGT_754m]
MQNPTRLSQLPTTRSKIDIIYQPIQSELGQVDQSLRNLGGSESQHIKHLLGYLFDRGGKGLRPALTLLSSKLFNNKVNHNAVTMATAVELLHIATLVHDDTIDDSSIRRGKQTISKRWDSNIAILVGDYVFATSATIVCTTGNLRVVHRFSETIMELSSGQLMEYLKSHDPTPNREEYLTRIYLKTASLFRTALETGALLSEAPESALKHLVDYGYNLGMAFQIVDDILDVEATEKEMGKSVGNDLLQGVLTLPTIIFLEENPNDDSIAKFFGSKGNPEHLKQIISRIQSSDIIERCYSEAQRYCYKAKTSLRNFPKSDALTSLEKLVEFVMERRR